MGAVVVGHRKIGQTTVAGLRDQFDGIETAVTAEGVTVKVETARAAFRSHLFENRAEWVDFRSHHNVLLGSAGMRFLPWAHQEAGIEPGIEMMFSSPAECS